MGFFTSDAIVLHRKPHAIKRHIGTRVLFPSGTQPSLTQVDLGHPIMHQPQKRQTSRTPATQIQVSSQKSAEILSVPLRPSWEVSDIPHRPTVCIMSVYSTPSSKERHMARNAHPEVTRQRILDAAKSCSRKRGMSAPRFKIFSTSSKTSAKALSTIISKTKKRCCMRW